MANDYWTGSLSVCPSCGEPLEPGASFCTMCGASISSGGGSPMSSDTCSVCGAPLDPGASFCIMCGSPVGASSSPLPPSSGGSGLCPVCGEPLDPGASFCIMCGTPVGGGAQATNQFVDSFPPTFPPTSDSQPPYTPQPEPPTLEVYDPFDATGNGMGLGQKPSAPVAHTDEKMPDDDDPTVRPKLLMLTYDEARNGCTKSVNVDGQNIEVTIPAGVDVNTKLDVPNYGYFDEMTGTRGPLRLTFFLV